MSSDAPWLEFDGITKRFGSVTVLRDVTFSVPAAGTVGLVGENGAGKSTLMNILGGNFRPESGQMRLAGAPFQPRSPDEATRAGVAFIHQELNLFANLTVAENLFLTAFPTVGRLPLIHRRGLRELAGARLAQVGLNLDPDLPLERLSAGERQLVEIAKALGTGTRLLILDEPTTSLSAREAEVLFALLGRLRARGLAMLYISHNLGEVQRLCEQIVVLRDGAVVSQGPRAAYDTDRLVALMVGRNLTQFFPERRQAPGAEVLLDVAGVSQPGVVRNIRFALHCGEILGLAGLMGAGRSELARILFGLEPCANGEVRLLGEDLRRLGPSRRIQRGLAFLTENRREEGLCLDAAIADNITLATLRSFARPPAGWLSRPKLRAAVARLREAVRLSPGAADRQPVRTLSGGNQQKVVLAKWLLANPRVLILDEPTRGIDVGAKAEVYRLIADLADRGTGVLLISSELEELMGLCDRILVLRRGEISATVPRAQFDRERLLRAALADGTSP